MQNSTTSQTEETKNETVQIPLSKGFYATVDIEDHERVSKHKWTALQTPWTVYARRTWRSEDGKQHSMYLHRFIMQPQPNEEVDHRDGDGRNCTRANMRIATKSNNAHNQKRKKTNTSGIKGVSFFKAVGRWRADITHNNKLIYLGSFLTKEEAGAAYATAAKMLHKDFHKLE